MYFKNTDSPENPEPKEKEKMFGESDRNVSPIPSQEMLGEPLTETACPGQTP